MIEDQAPLHELIFLIREINSIVKGHKNNTVLEEQIREVWEYSFNKHKKEQSLNRSWLSFSLLTIQEIDRLSAICIKDVKYKRYPLKPIFREEVVPFTYTDFMVTRVMAFSIYNKEKENLRRLRKEYLDECLDRLSVILAIRDLIQTDLYKQFSDKYKVSER